MTSRFWLFLLIVSISLFCLYQSVCAAVLNVSTGEELAAALLVAAGNGEDDTIYLAAGVYSQTSTFTYDSHEDRSLTVTATGERAILDGSFSNSRILFIRTYTSSAHVSLKNITLQNGYSPEGNNGAGLLANIAGADLLLDEVIIKDCFGAAFYFTVSGGGAYITCGLGANLIMRNCIISGNSAKGYGGGLYLNLIDGRLDFINNTVINNHNRASAVEQGGGVYLHFYYDTSTAHLHNNIFWGNTWAHGDGDLFIVNDRDGNGSGTFLAFTHNNIGFWDATTLDGLMLDDNLAVLPLLDGEGRLQHGSPCIDQGKSDIENMPLLDIGGNSRSLDGNCTDGAQPDLGAYEYIGLAEVMTMEPYGITSAAAESGGEVLSQGGFPVTARGVCWSAEYLPDLEDSCSNDGEGIGSFFTSISGLSPHTGYHLRAYASTCLGVAYGDELSFSTSLLPGVTTMPIRAIMPSFAHGGGEVISEGDFPVTARGICWHREPFPDLTTHCSKDGSGSGLYTSTLYDLIENDTYYVRAYATNANGTAYGQQLQFVTARQETSWLLYLPAMLRQQ